MASLPSRRTKVFISYSHKDTKYLHEFLPFLKYYEKDELIDLWVDTKIKPGERWQEEIEVALKSVRVAILFVSIDFLNSPFIVSNELPQLLSAAETEGVTILPVILRSCTLPRSLLRFHAINDSDRPLAKLRKYEREVVWVDVAKSVIDIITIKDSKIIGDVLNEDSRFIEKEKDKDLEAMLQQMQQKLQLDPKSVIAKRDKI